MQCVSGLAVRGAFSQSKLNGRRRVQPMIVSTAPFNLWTSDEFVALVGTAVAHILRARSEDSSLPDDNVIDNLVIEVCYAIPCQVMPAGNA